MRNKQEWVARQESLREVWVVKVSISKRLPENLKIPYLRINPLKFELLNERENS